MNVLVGILFFPFMVMLALMGALLICGGIFMVVVVPWAWLIDIIFPDNKFSKFIFEFLK